MAPASQLKLYTNVRSRGSIVEWYLKELGVQYEPVTINMQKKEHKEEWFTSINPLGKVPALVHGDLKLCESGAMLLFIADKYDERVETAEDRALCAQWVLFAYTDMAELLFNKNLPEGRMEAVMTYLESRLAAHPFVAGPEFTIADVAVGSHLVFSKVFLPQLDLGKWPAVAAYEKRISARPACEAWASVVCGANMPPGK
ncbi:hypothetical protein WJX81_000362 [Elliptochloris bilobata]|uniref:Glutathione S-transferase n=1 Tax=Elliptochloris bilobata TaxID=381761 RepID=A0AAW1RNY4_9CHLO